MRIAIVATDPITAESLGCLLSNSGGHEVVMCACHFGDVKNFEPFQPELFVVTEGFDDPAHQLILRTLRQSGVRILVLAESSGSDRVGKEYDTVVVKSNGVGALFAAILRMESVAGITTKVHEVGPIAQTQKAAPGSTRSTLTAREREAADLVARGLRDREIAELMGTGEQNVKALISRARRLLGCKNRTELAILMNKSPLG